MRVKVLLVLFLLLTAEGASARQATGKRPAADALRGFDEFVRAVMTEWKVPGLAVAMVSDGEVVLAKGYGYRDVGRKLPVTPRTLMPIGSNTKAFTAAVLGTLVDEKRLEWDQPVRNYLGDFRLADETAERLATARDLMSHRTGLPRHDALYYGRTYTRQELYARLRHLEFNRTFRQRWQYNNLLVMTAGVLAERVTGETWEGLVRVPADQHEPRRAADAHLGRGRGARRARAERLRAGPERDELPRPQAALPRRRDRRVRLGHGVAAGGEARRRGAHKLGRVQPRADHP